MNEKHRHEWTIGDYKYGFEYFNGIVAECKDKSCGAWLSTKEIEHRLNAYIPKLEAVIEVMREHAEYNSSGIPIDWVAEALEMLTESDD